MSGITRINIESDWHDWRVQLAEDHAPVADEIYRAVFEGIGLPLADGDETVSVSKQEAQARYDWAEGIDVILTTQSGQRMTLQEKFLTYYKSTATFEERKTSGARGFWYYGTPQYYFVGYTRRYWDYRRRQVVENPVIDFQDWILIDFPALRRYAPGIDWHYNKNAKDRRRASFRYLYFEEVPEPCVISNRSTFYATVTGELYGELPY